MTLAPCLLLPKTVIDREPTLVFKFDCACLRLFRERGGLRNVGVINNAVLNIFNNNCKPASNQRIIQFRFAVVAK